MSGGAVLQETGKEQTETRKCSGIGVTYDGDLTGVVRKRLFDQRNIVGGGDLV